jgi:hypothetical protein
MPHTDKVIFVNKLRNPALYKHTFSGSERVNMVTKGIYTRARTEPNAQVLKYRLRNQSCCAEPAFTRNNQKHNSREKDQGMVLIYPLRISSPSRCVTLEVIASAFILKIELIKMYVHLEAPCGGE